MSANLLVDLGNTTQQGVSIMSTTAFPGSGAVVGDIVDMIHANTYCNLQIIGKALDASGMLRVVVQTSDSTASGSFTDPTSGMAPNNLPGIYQSGTVLFINSGGLLNGTLQGGVSGQYVQSGFAAAQGFIRTGRYVRAIALSGDFYRGALSATFISQLKMTGSGAGSTQLPGSGSLNV